MRVVRAGCNGCAKTFGDPRDGRERCRFIERDRNRVAINSAQIDVVTTGLGDYRIGTSRNADCDRVKKVLVHDRCAVVMQTTSERHREPVDTVRDCDEPITAVIRRIQACDDR